MKLGNKLKSVENFILGSVTETTIPGRRISLSVAQIGPVVMVAAARYTITTVIRTGRICTRTAIDTITMLELIAIFGFSEKTALRD
jgi:hypothetical protein